MCAHRRALCGASCTARNDVGNRSDDQQVERQRFSPAALLRARPYAHPRRRRGQTVLVQSIKRPFRWTCTRRLRVVGTCSASGPKRKGTRRKEQGNKQQALNRAVLGANGKTRALSTATPLRPTTAPHAPARGYRSNSRPHTHRRNWTPSAHRRLWQLRRQTDRMVRGRRIVGVAMGRPHTDVGCGVLWKPMGDRSIPTAIQCRRGCNRCHSAQSACEATTWPFPSFFAVAFTAAAVSAADASRASGSASGASTDGDSLSDHADHCAKRDGLHRGLGRWHIGLGGGALRRRVGLHCPNADCDLEDRDDEAR